MLAYIVGLIALIIGTLTDIDHREVPDWINYSLIAAGIILSILLSTARATIQPLIASILGLVVGYLIGALMYYTGQWGGGDAKMIMGLGALLGIPLSILDLTIPFFFYFIIASIFVGAAYGITWLIVLFIIHRKTYWPLIRSQLGARRTRTIRLTLGLLLLVYAGITLMYTNVWNIIVFIILFTVYLTVILSVIVRVIEQHAFLKKKEVHELVPGDWLAEDVSKGKKVLLNANNTGISEEEIALLKKNNVSTVLVKEGIPFVPSFLIAYILAYVLYIQELSLF